MPLNFSCVVSNTGIDLDICFTIFIRFAQDRDHLRRKHSLLLNGHLVQILQLILKYFGEEDLVALDLVKLLGNQLSRGVVAWVFLDV